MKGFTLIEVLVCAVIIAILCTLAIPKILHHHNPCQEYTP